MRTLLIAGAAVFALTGLAQAAESDASGRYTLSPTEGGFVRMDTTTGAVSTCTGTLETLVCRSVADDRQALQSEIDRLSSENEALREELANNKGAGATDGTAGITVPSDEDVDKAMGFLEKMVKRFKALIKELQEEPAETTPL